MDELAFEFVSNLFPTAERAGEIHIKTMQMIDRERERGSENLKRALKSQLEALLAKLTHLLSKMCVFFFLCSCGLLNVFMCLCLLAHYQ